MDESTTLDLRGARTSAALNEDRAVPSRPDDPKSMIRLRIEEPQKDLFDQVVEDMPDPAVVTDLDSNILLANGAADRLFRCFPGALVGQSVSDLLPDSDEGQPLASSNPGPEQLPTSSAARQFRRLDGTRFHGTTVGGPIRSRAGSVTGHLVVFRDLSQRVAAEQALQQLHAITSNRKLKFIERLDAILELGAEHFGLPLGILSHIQGDRYEVIRAVAQESPPQPGTVFELGQTYCVHTLEADGPTGFHHAGTSRIQDHPCYQTFHLESYLGAPILVNRETYGTLNFSSPLPTRPFSHQDLELVRLFADWAGHEIEREMHLERIQDAQDELERQASTDALTGVYNRRALIKRVDHEISRALRYGHPLSILLMDLDHFKAINDQYGHAAGDQVLQAFAEMCEHTLRDIDAVGRWGGEEFLVVLPDTSREHAARCAERLCEATRELEVRCGDQTIRFSVSLGVGDLQNGLTREQLLSTADKALYKAKEMGRDRVWPPLSG